MKSLGFDVPGQDSESMGGLVYARRQWRTGNAHTTLLPLTGQGEMA